MKRGANYGIDSPGIIAGLLVAAGLSFSATRFLPHLFRMNLLWLEWIACGYFLLGAAGMLFYSKRGKLGYRDQILAAVPWRGDESVLDAGCGRGLLLIGAVRRLQSGRATGVDIWLPGAITGNRPEAVLQNASAEGVSGRVQLAAGNARSLPFKNACFDVLVSNYLIHEVNTAAERKEILTEMARVLKPGGHLAIIDFIFTRECVAVLREAGLENASRARLGGPVSFWLGCITSFGTAQNYLVTAQKAPHSAVAESNLSRAVAPQAQ